MEEVVNGDNDGDEASSKVVVVRAQGLEEKRKMTRFMRQIDVPAAPACLCQLLPDQSHSCFYASDPVREHDSIPDASMAKADRDSL